MIFGNQLVKSNVKNNMKYLLIILLSVLIYTAKGATIQSNASGNWNNAGTWIGGVIPGANDDIEIINGNTITITSNVSIHNITITNGTISIGSYTLSIYGNISGNTNNISSTANSILEIKDAGSSSKFTIPANIIKLQKIIINRKNGVQTDHSIDLDDAVPADSIVLVLTNGIVYMNNNSILYMNSQAIKRNIPCSDSSHIDGPIQRDIKKNSGFHVYPLGDNGIARPMSIAAQNGTNNINQGQFIYATPPNNNNVDVSKLPGGIFQNFYWDHQLISSANTQRRIYYRDSDFPNISNSNISNYFYLANTDGITDWTIPTTPREVDTVNKWISFSNSNASNDRYWTFGSTSSSVQIDQIVLPIELIYFEAKLSSSGINLNWATASETNNQNFIIQRSSNGIDFETIETIPGAGNSYNIKYYSILDENAKSSIVYYRLIQIDYNGKSTVSNIINIENVYNTIYCDFIPLKQGIWECKIKGNKSPNISYKIISYSGSILKSNTIDLNNSDSFILNLKEYCKSEVFVFVIVNIDNENFLQKISIN